jgi:hypothetical protein
MARSLVIPTDQSLDVFRILTAKVVHDVKNTPATRDLLAFITSQVLGGDPTVRLPRANCI